MFTQGLKIHHKEEFQGGGQVRVVGGWEDRVGKQVLPRFCHNKGRDPRDTVYMYL